jgi:hypothetical protein
MKEDTLQEETKPLIIYLDDDGSKKITYSKYCISNAGTISFDTQQNTIIIPISRLIKIKFDKKIS